MDRRSVLKNLALLGGGMVLAPSCTFSAEQVSIALNNLNITGKQEQLLADVVEAFIPATDIPGAKALKIHHFVLVMIDDCRNKQEQNVFIRGLNQLDLLAEHQYESEFFECTSSQRENLLSGTLEGHPELKSLGAIYNEVRQCLSMTKRYAIQGFLSSEYVMINELPYQLVPGHFEGCVPVGQKS